jgi:hypothetical protein
VKGALDRREATRGRGPTFNLASTVQPRPPFVLSRHRSRRRARPSPASATGNSRR